MHETLLNEMIKTCRRRLEQGDCPTVPQPSAGALERALLAAADEVDRLESLLGNSELAVAELLEQIKQFQPPT